MGDRARRGGFVTLDLLWIIALLGLVVVLSIRGIGLVEKREISERLTRESLLVAEAVEKLAVEKGLKVGAVVSFAEYGPFLSKKAPERLRENGLDQLGGEFAEQSVGEPAVPAASTVEALGQFWE